MNAFASNELESDSSQRQSIFNCVQQKEGMEMDVSKFKDLSKIQMLSYQQKEKSKIDKRGNTGQQSKKSNIFRDNEIDDVVRPENPSFFNSYSEENQKERLQKLSQFFDSHEQSPIVVDKQIIPSETVEEIRERAFDNENLNSSEKKIVNAYQKRQDDKAEYRIKIKKLKVQQSMEPNDEEEEEKEKEKTGFFTSFSEVDQGKRLEELSSIILNPNNGKGDDFLSAPLSKRKKNKILKLEEEVKRKKEIEKKKIFQPPKRQLPLRKEIPQSRGGGRGRGMKENISPRSYNRPNQRRQIQNHRRDNNEHRSPPRGRFIPKRVDSRLKPPSGHTYKKANPGNMKIKRNLSNRGRGNRMGRGNGILRMGVEMGKGGDIRRRVRSVRMGKKIEMFEKREIMK